MPLEEDEEDGQIVRFSYRRIRSGLAILIRVLKVRVVDWSTASYIKSLIVP